LKNYNQYLENDLLNPSSGQNNNKLLSFNVASPVSSRRSSGKSLGAKSRNSSGSLEPENGGVN
jgi:hypothetical protein